MTMVDGRPRDVRLTDHARERCAEFGISTKVAKSIVRDPEVDYRQGDRDVDERVAQRGEWAVVYATGMKNCDAVIVTVLRRDVEEWIR